MFTLDQIRSKDLTPEKLGELLLEAKKAYYTGGRPIMDDHTYDTLEDILRKTSPHHRIFSKVGTPAFDTGWDKKPHTHPMSSQNKVSNFDDLKHYFELKKLPPDTEFVVEPKCDGISLELIYRQGTLVEAITRGDGLVGDVITQNVINMQGFVAHPPDFTGSVRCEIVVTKKDFQKLNAVADEDYSNPRNAASGLSQRLDSKYSEICTLIAVDIIPAGSTEVEKLNRLKDLGFTVVDSSVVKNFTEIETIYQQYLTADRLSYPYDIDGLVVKVNDLSQAFKLGSLNNRPKFQVAYKFPASADTTVIKAVTWQVGPLGTITPVAEVEPIELSGAVITYASLANYDLIREKNLNIGDVVRISRRGDVIPHIESVVTKVTPGHLIAPTHCPSCGTLLTIEDKFLRCRNALGCQAQILGSLRLFCDSLNILGLSDKTIAKLYSAGRVRLPGDFFILTVSDINDLENLGDKSARNIINQIQSKRALSLVEAFDAAIIPNFSSKRILQVISAGFDTPDRIKNLTVDDLLTIKGFKQTLARKIIDGLTLRRSWIDSILKYVHLKSAPKNQKSALTGLTFAITGDLSRPRKDIEAEIEARGGRVVSSVSKNTSYLLTNESESNSSKFTAAKKLHIPLISEAEFAKLL